MAVQERQTSPPTPPAIYDPEALLNDHDPDMDGSDGNSPDGEATLHLLRNVLQNAELEAERVAGMQRMSGMLRSILADRMVTAPAEELDATDAMRDARRRIYGSSSVPQDEQSSNS